MTTSQGIKRHMYILKHILLFMALVFVDISATVITVHIVKSNFLDLPLYVYSIIGGSVSILGALVYLPLFYKLKESK